MTGRTRPAARRDRRDGADVPDVLDLFGTWCARTPAAVAVEDDDGSLTYAQLDRAANGYARALRDHRVGPETVVAITADRSPQYVAMMLGVLRAGAAFLPIEPTTPVHRASQMCRGADVRVLLVQPAHQGFAADLAAELATAGTPAISVVPTDPAEEGSPMAPTSRDPGGLAYVIFTSGSTGVPKGAMVTSGGMANHVAAKVRDLTLGPGDAVGFTAPLSFDISVWQALTALTVGARICVATPVNLAEPVELLAWVRRHEVTVLEIVPSFLAVVLDTLADSERARASLRSVRTLISTGEALPGRLARRWHGFGLGASLMNAYGPTECSDDVTHHIVTPDESSTMAWPPIGREILNTRVYVVDDLGRELPTETMGALWVGGAGVGRGYIGDPVSTALAFVPDELSGQPGARLYRTGDRGERAADGTIRFAGRDDRQVKVRGHRIELGDVEAELLRLPQLATAACVLSEGRLRAFVTLGVGESGKSDPVTGIMAMLRTAAPRHLIPHEVTVVDRLPTGPTGKVDYAALARQAAQPAHGDMARADDGARADAVASADEAAPADPDTGLAVVCAMVAEVVGAATVGPDDDFFGVGGDSLQAMTLMAVARKRFGAEGASLREFLATPTPRGLLAVLTSAEPVPPARFEPAAGALSSGQERFWFLEQLHPRRVPQLIRLSLTLRGPLERRALRHALRAVVARHETLRMVFSADRGMPVATVWPEAEVVLEEVSGGDTDTVVTSDLSARTARPPLMRARLVEVGPDHHVLTLVLHHLVADGFSLTVLGREICTYYAKWTTGDTEVPLPETTFTRYVEQEREWLRSTGGKECERYWAERLDGAPPVIDLPWDKPRPSVPDFTAGHAVRELTEEQTRAVVSLARELRATPFMVVLAALYSVLRDLAGTYDLVVGIDSANRSWPGSEHLVGTFVNQLPLRLTAPWQTSSLRELVAVVRTECLSAYAHDRLPFHKIVAAANPPRRLGRLPLFQVKAAHQGVWGYGLTLPGIDVVSGEVSEPATDLDLMLEVSGEASRLRLELVYRIELLEPDTARAWVEAIAGVLCSGTIRGKASRVSDPGAQEGTPLAAAAQHGQPPPTRPLTPTEAVVSAVWCELLTLDAVGVTDNFFEVGGHSMVAAQAVYQLAERTGIDLDLETFFDLGTVEAVAAEIDRLRAATHGAEPSLVYEGEL